MATRCAGTGSRFLTEAPPVVVAPGIMRGLIEPLLPDGIDVRWFMSAQEAIALAPQADIGWFDEFTLEARKAAPLAATRARWINTILAGLDDMPVNTLRQRGVTVTKGVGLNADAVADYAVMGLLTLFKGFADVVRAHDRREWLMAAPATGELAGSKALIIGHGTIGQAIGARLAAFGVEVTGVRRCAVSDEGVLGADDWRSCLGDFDSIILAAPATSDTDMMIGTGELTAMKRGAFIVNVARGSLIDQPALIAALNSGHIGGAMLDVTEPEPLPADHPLWSTPRCIVTMHMAGRSQTTMFREGAARFADNLRRYLAGDPLIGVADLAKGY